MSKRTTTLPDNMIIDSDEPCHSPSEMRKTATYTSSLSSAPAADGPFLLTRDEALNQKLVQTTNLDAGSTNHLNQQQIVSKYPSKASGKNMYVSAIDIAKNIKANFQPSGCI